MSTRLCTLENEAPLLLHAVLRKQSRYACKVQAAHKPHANLNCPDFDLSGRMEIFNLHEIARKSPNSKTICAAARLEMECRISASSARHSGAGSSRPSRRSERGESLRTASLATTGMIPGRGGWKTPELGWKRICDGFGLPENLLTRHSKKFHDL